MLTFALFALLNPPAWELNTDPDVFDPLNTPATAAEYREHGCSVTMGVNGISSATCAGRRAAQWDDWGNTRVYRIDGSVLVIDGVSGHQEEL